MYRFSWTRQPSVNIVSRPKNKTAIASENGKSAPDLLQAGPGRIFHIMSFCIGSVNTDLFFFMMKCCIIKIQVIVL